MRDRIKYYVRQLMEWGIAILLAVLICNIPMFFYNWRPGWIERDKGATLAIWDPGAVLISALEGYGCYRIDEKGYVNERVPEKKGGQGYCLVVGASYTQGKEVPSGRRYTDILNKKISVDGSVAVYNVSQDGYFFPEIVQGFSALTQEFPDAETIVLEISSTKFMEQELIEALEQREFDPMQVGENVFATLSVLEKANIRIKETMPLLFGILQQLKTVKNLKEKDNIDTAYNEQIFLYEKYLRPVLKMLRTKYEGRLIIIYHPSVEIKKDGSLKCVWEPETEIFKEICEECSIVFIDTTQAILDEYKKDYSVPYGFMNTVMGNGHFSCAGHRIMADELYNVLEGGIG